MVASIFGGNLAGLVKWSNLRIYHMLLPPLSPTRRIVGELTCSEQPHFARTNSARTEPGLLTFPIIGIKVDSTITN
jgi:hypothetical protein